MHEPMRFSALRHGADSDEGLAIDPAALAYSLKPLRTAGTRLNPGRFKDRSSDPLDMGTPLRMPRADTRI